VGVAGLLRPDQQGDLEPFVAYQLEAIHDGLRYLIGSEKGSEKGSELAEKIGATPGASIDALIMWDLATEPTLSARRLVERLQLSQRAVEKHLAALQQLGRQLRHGSPRSGSPRGGPGRFPKAQHNVITRTPGTA
jgi:hypothetical protein